MTHTEMCDEIDSLRARLADEQAKRVAAEKAWCDVDNAWTAEVKELEAEVADLECRLSTVPEDFGPLLNELLSSFSSFVNDPDSARRYEWFEISHSALTEKIAALHARITWLIEQNDVESEDAQKARAERDALQSRLEAQRISHPTDVCDCRFDFGGGEMKVRNVCDYHKAMESRLATCELALAAVCDTNGGELYWSRETLDGLNVKTVEIDDTGEGVYFRVVEKPVSIGEPK